MKCARCGAKVLLGSAQCTKCGASMLDGSLPQDVAPAGEWSMIRGSGAPAPPEPPERSMAVAGSSASAPPPPPRTVNAPAPPHRPPIKVQRGRRATPAGQASKASIGCAGCLVPLLALVAVGVGVTAASTSVFEGVGDVFDSGERLVAPAIVVGQPIEFELGSDDTGVHDLTAPATGPVVVTVQAVGDFDPKVRVLDDDGTELGSDDDSGGGHDSLLRVDLVEGDAYEVEVVEYSGDAGDYVLLVESSVVDGVPVGRASQVDGAVQAGETARHLLAGPGGELTVRVLGREGFDPVLTIRDGGGDVLGTNDDADGRDSRLTLAVPLDTTVVIEVQGFNDAGGSYTVVVE